LKKVDLIIMERKLRWLGHLSRVDDDRLPRQAVCWDLDTAKQKPGRPRKNWNDTIHDELKAMGLTWGEAQQLAANRNEWRQCVANVS